MDSQWSIDKIKSLINNKIEESLVLEYKSSEALINNPKNKKEITKDISAMANSEGGTIIYGIKEYTTDDMKGLPEQIMPISPRSTPKEWLEQVINRIRPKIDGIYIEAVNLDDNNESVVYIIVIPKGDTAHQAIDHRYYKRYNFMSTPMEDYEVRDVMARNKSPRFDISMKIVIKENSETQYSSNGLISIPVDVKKNEYTLIISGKNIGAILANYVNLKLSFPIEILPDYERDDSYQIKGKKYKDLFVKNTIRDIVDTEFLLNHTHINKYGPSRYDPILPGLSKTWEFDLCENFNEILLSNLEIKWIFFADNSKPKAGVIKVENIKIEKNN